MWPVWKKSDLDKLEMYDLNDKDLSKVTQMILILRDIWTGVSTTLPDGMDWREQMGTLSGVEQHDVCFVWV